MTGELAKTISTCSIWLGTTVILTLGVFHMNWNGDGAMLLMVLIVVVISGAAGVSTAAVWGWKPGKSPSDERHTGG